MKRLTGNKGEDSAVRFLEKQGYKILERNYRTPFGELDIIAKDGSTVVFIEVKTRLHDSHGSPQESITARKIAKMTNLALYYLSRFKETPLARFDAVSVRVVEGKEYIEHIKDAFEMRNGWI